MFNYMPLERLKLSPGRDRGREILDCPKQSSCLPWLSWSTWALQCITIVIRATIRITALMTRKRGWQGPLMSLPYNWSVCKKLDYIHLLRSFVQHTHCSKSQYTLGCFHCSINCLNPVDSLYMYCVLLQSCMCRSKKFTSSSGEFGRGQLYSSIHHNSMQLTINCLHSRRGVVSWITDWISQYFDIAISRFCNIQTKELAVE